MTHRKPGRVRKRIAELLQAQGFDVEAEDLDTQEGAYRGPHWDLARWFANCEKDGKPVYIYSWDTMTDCVRHGLEVGAFEHPNSYEIHTAG